MNNLDIPQVHSIGTPYFFISFNQSGLITFVSPSIETVLGFFPEQLCGNSYLRLFERNHPLNDDFNASVEQKFNGDASHSHSIRSGLDAKNDKKLLSIQIYGVRDESGIVVRCHGWVQDITDQMVLNSTWNATLLSLKEVHDELTERELAVLDRILDGRLNKSIARELEVSERTIETDRRRLFKKFEAETIAQLVSKAIQYRMLVDVITIGHPSHSMRGPWSFFGKPHDSSKKSGIEIRQTED